MAAQGEVNNKPNKAGADSLASALPHATAATLTNNRAISSPGATPGAARGDGVPALGSSARRAAARASPRAAFFGLLAGAGVIPGGAGEDEGPPGTVGSQNSLGWKGPLKGESSGRGLGQGKGCAPRQAPFPGPDPAPRGSTATPGSRIRLPDGVRHPRSTRDPVQ